MKPTLKSLLPLLLMALVGVLSVSAVHADDWNASRASRAEVRFLEGMSDHHQMAVDMAQDCLKKNVADDLKTICQNVIDAQTAEIQQMHDWLLNWYGIEYHTMPMSAMSGGGGGTMGMMGEMCDMAHMDKMDDMHKHMCAMMMGGGMMGMMGKMCDMAHMDKMDAMHKHTCAMMMGGMDGMDGMGDMDMHHMDDKGHKGDMDGMGGMQAEATPGMCAEGKMCGMDHMDDMSGTMPEATPDMGDMGMHGMDGMDSNCAADQGCDMMAEETPEMGGMDSMCAADQGCDMMADATPEMGGMQGMEGMDSNCAADQGCDMRAEETPPPGHDHLHGADTVTATATPGMDGMDMSGGQHEGMSDPAGMMGMFAGFSRLDGKDYEVAWLESMIDHHDDALHMAQRILKLAEHPEVITLANNIIRDQTAEIEKMEAMLSARAAS